MAVELTMYGGAGEKKRWPRRATTTTTLSCDLGTEGEEECLVLSVTLTFTFRMTGSSGTNKYNVFNNLRA
jgi:hypothetical protein